MASLDAVPAWIRGLRRGLTAFLEKVRYPGAYGRFRYAPDGCILPHESISSRYAFDILDWINAYQDLRKHEQAEWVTYLLSFQDANTGEFWSAELGRLCTPESEGANPGYLMRRMLTRNTSSMLQRMGQAPRYVLRYPEADSFTDKSTLINHLSSSPWDTNPWGAGSHAGTTARMLWERLKRGEEEYRLPVKWAIDYLQGIQDPESGLWGSPSCPLYERINGAFKVVARMINTFGILPAYPERIIDSVFAHYEDPTYELTGCNEFDNIWLLAAALRTTDHRREEIEHLVAGRLAFIQPFTKDDGGFSFFKEVCITTNAQVQLVDSPRPQGDMVGTATFVACLASAFEILGWNSQVGWKGLWADAPKKAVIP